MPKADPKTPKAAARAPTQTLVPAPSPLGDVAPQRIDEVQDQLVADRPAKEPSPAIFPRPEASASLAEAVTQDAFYLPAGLVEGWFIRRSDVLIVTFDNLSSIDEYVPPQPWMQARAAKGNFSVLGVMASRRDWYRNADAPNFLIALRDAGFFAQFRRVIFTGASMGGFAALSLAHLVPGAAVLAFSPQSTLSRKIAPFESRYRFAARKWDWQGPYHDAAQTLPHTAEVWIVYDPHMPEDAAHIARLHGPQVRLIHAPHMGHRAIRHLKGIGVLQSLIEDVAHQRFDPKAFAKALRGRRDLRAWQRSLLEAAEAKGHYRLGAAAARRLGNLFPDTPLGRRFARKFDALAAAPPAKEGADQPKAKPARDKAKATPPTTAAEDRQQWILDPAPQAPFTGEILTLSQALVVPERSHDAPLASGVLHSDGRWCDLSKAWIRARKSSPAPTLDPSEPIRDLPGTHLFGGHFRGHFGHFLVESTARLWALGHLETPPDSLVYLPYRGNAAAVARAIEGQSEFFRLLGIEMPVQTFAEVLRVERLIVPELGFGWLERYAGSPAYRQFMQSRLSAAAPAEGGEKLYVSRARLNAQRGGILGETVIEENLARLGWEIFHPEKHPLEVQIARYKAARQIIALDGSALHLAAYVMPPRGRLAMILRRSKANSADYELQFRNFCDIAPDVIDVIRYDWVAGEAGRVDFRSVGEIDFAALFDRLKVLGYVPQDFQPDLPSETEIHSMLESFEDRRGAAFRPLAPGERHGDEEDET